MIIGVASRLQWNHKLNKSITVRIGQRLRSQCESRAEIVRLTFCFHVLHLRHACAIIALLDVRCPAEPLVDFDISSKD